MQKEKRKKVESSLTLFSNLIQTHFCHFFSIFDSRKFRFRTSFGLIQLQQCDDFFRRDDILEQDNTSQVTVSCCSKITMAAEQIGAEDTTLSCCSCIECMTSIELDLQKNRMQKLVIAFNLLVRGSGIESKGRNTGCRKKTGKVVSSLTLLSSLLQFHFWVHLLCIPVVQRR